MTEANGSTHSQDGEPDAWDMLAPLWDMFEESFFSPKHLAGVTAEESPALVVGAGAGILYEELIRLGLRSVYGVDSSTGMAKAALERRGLPVLVIKNNAVPFPADSFRLIVCASGVISSAYTEASRSMLSELRRLLSPEGRLLVGMPSFHEDHPFRALGFIEDNTLHFARLLETWLRNSKSETVVPLVAEWTGTSSQEATEIAREFAPVLEDVCSFYDEIADRVLSLGQEPESYLQKCFSWSLAGFDVEDITAFLEQAGLEVIELNQDVANDLVVATCKHA